MYVFIYFDVQLTGFVGTTHISMFGKQKKQRPVISEPTDFVHRVHTGYDPAQGKFVGLPQQWHSVVDAPANRPRPLVDQSRVTSANADPLKVSIYMFSLKFVYLCN